jgi:mannitol-specific phosphotransferase system IIBC component
MPDASVWIGTQKPAARHPEQHGPGRHGWRRIVILAALAGFSLSLAGCDNVPMEGQGALVGAGIGGVLGYVIGGEKGAALGALAGAGAGALGGHALAGKQQEFASDEDELRARTAQARHAAVEQRQHADAANDAARSAERQVRELRQAAARGQGSSARRSTVLSKLRSDQAALEQDLKNGNTAEQTLRSQANALQRKGQDTSRLQAEVVNLQHSNAKLQGALYRLNKAMGNIDA